MVSNKAVLNYPAAVAQLKSLGLPDLACVLSGEEDILLTIRISAERVKRETGEPQDKPCTCVTAPADKQPEQPRACADRLQLATKQELPEEPEPDEKEEEKLDGTFEQIPIRCPKELWSDWRSPKTDEECDGLFWTMQDIHNYVAKHSSAKYLLKARRSFVNPDYVFSARYTKKAVDKVLKGMCPGITDWPGVRKTFGETTGRVFRHHRFGPIFVRECAKAVLTHLRDTTPEYFRRYGPRLREKAWEVIVRDLRHDTPGIDWRQFLLYLENGASLSPRSQTLAWAEYCRKVEKNQADALDAWTDSGATTPPPPGYTNPYDSFVTMVLPSVPLNPKSHTAKRLQTLVDWKTHPSTDGDVLVVPKSDLTLG